MLASFGLPGLVFPQDFLKQDLQNWYPEIAGRIKITLVEALPSVLPMFSKVSPFDLA